MLPDSQPITFLKGVTRPMLKYFATTAVEDKVTGRFLMAHHVGKVRPWRFPGGKIDTIKGESPVQASIRELYEEVGITPKDPKPRFLGVRHIQADGDLWIGYSFHITEWFGEPRIQEPAKHDELRWLYPSELDALGSDFESSLVTLSRLTPIQERILNLIVDFQDEAGVNNEQLAARAGIPFWTFVNEMKAIRRAANIRSRKEHRPEIAAWWRSMRGGL